MLLDGITQLQRAKRILENSHIHEKLGAKFFQKDVESENPKFCFLPEGFGIPHDNTMAETGALGNAVLEVLSSLVSAGTLHINDKRRKRREGNT